MGQLENDPKKQWEALCKQAATEADPERLMALVQEISRLLDQQLKLQQPQSKAS